MQAPVIPYHCGCIRFAFPQAGWKHSIIRAGGAGDLGTEHGLSFVKNVSYKEVFPWARFDDAAAALSARQSGITELDDFEDPPSSGDEEDGHWIERRPQDPKP